jgi:hypothetical protein
MHQNKIKFELERQIIEENKLITKHKNELILFNNAANNLIYDYYTYILKFEYSTFSLVRSRNTINIKALENLNYSRVTNLKNSIDTINKQLKCVYERQRDELIEMRINHAKKIIELTTTINEQENSTKEISIKTSKTTNLLNRIMCWIRK